MILERAPATEESAEELLRFSIPFHVEHFYGPLNPAKALASMWAIIEKGGAFTVREGGALVGTIGLYTASPWMTDREFLTNEWLHTTVEGVGLLLLKGARDEALRLKLPLIIGRSNHTRIAGSGLGRTAEYLGFFPFGHETRIA